MPDLNHKGPRSEGPKTGKKLGNCRKTADELKQIEILSSLKIENDDFLKTKNNKAMKIAVPVTNNNQIDGHFGHCEYYNIYSISENNEISSVDTILSEQGCGCKSNIAMVLANNGVNTMLAGGIGGGAINVLNQAGINVIRGCEGNATEIVNAFINGEIEDSGSSCQQHEHHHDHHHDHHHGNGHHHSCEH